MEKAKAEVCPCCHGTQMTNLVYVRTGQDTRVYVKCTACGCYVARYVLSRYTSDRGYEALLERLRGFAHRSGKRCLEEIEEFGTLVQAEFEHVQAIAEPDPQSRRVEEMIRDTRTGETQDKQDSDKGPD